MVVYYGIIEKNTYGIGDNMALVKCPECGRENVSDTAKACPGCGYNVKAYYDKKYKITKESSDESKDMPINREVILEEPIKSKKNKTLIIIMIIFCILSVAFAIVVQIANAERQRSKLEQEYNTAIEKYNEGNYKEAIDYFESTDYSESTTYLTLSKYALAKQMIKNKENIDKAYDILVELGDYQDSAILINQYYYLKGISNYEEGLFDIAKEYFELDNNFEDTELYLNNIDKILPLQGEWLWQTTNPFDKNIRGFVVDKWKITFYRNSELMGVDSDTMTFDINDIKENKLTFQTDIRKYELTFSGNQMVGEMIKDIIMAPYKDDSPITFLKAEFLKDIIKEKPQIGMTADEVKKSTWGIPDEINKDTYSWGTREQWCYSGYRYIYLEDGIVTSISE